MATTRFRVGEWLVDPEIDEVSRVVETIKLEPRMMRLLLRLAETPGQVVSTQQLLESVWTGVVVGPASVYQAVSQLRKLLGDTDPTPTYIQTVQRKGYRLVAPVQPPEKSAVAAAATAEPAAPRRKVWLAFAIPATLLVVVGVALLLNRKPDAVATAPAPAAKPAETNALPVSSRAARRAIAVLPFKKAPTAEEDEAIAVTLTELLRNRLASSPNAIVIASYSAARATTQKGADTKAISALLHARYLVRGSVERAGAVVRIEVSLLDALAGTDLWSTKLERSASVLAATSDQLAGEITRALRLPFDAPPASRPVNPDAYLLYVKGTELLSTGELGDTEEAHTLFKRAVMLDPEFARGHLGLGQAAVMKATIQQAWTPSEFLAAESAFARALELDPGLGEVWTGRALCEDHVDAEIEEFHRRAVKLAPNDARTHKEYAAYLWRVGRGSEAFGLTERLSAIDPLSPRGYIMEAALVIGNEQDIAEQERLLRQALELDPKNKIALMELGQVQAFWKSDFAEGIRLNEAALRSDPDFSYAVMPLVSAYLDIGDPAAAESLAGKTTNTYSKLQIAVYRRQTALAASLAKQFVKENVFTGAEPQYVGQALLVDALARNDLPEAARLLESLYERSKDLPIFQNPVTALMYAHTLILLGENQRGTSLARELLLAIDERNPGAGVRFHGPIGAAAHVMLGEEDFALTALEASQELKHFSEWWYFAELDPLFAPLRQHPRFRALVDRANQHRAKQRAVLEQMRRKGEVPMRPARK